MIQAFLRDCWNWLRDDAWPAITDAYADNEPLRHVITFAVGAFVGWVFL